jgi:hypothetical protein
MPDLLAEYYQLLFDVNYFLVRHRLASAFYIDFLVYYITFSWTVCVVV